MAFTSANRRSSTPASRRPRRTAYDVTRRRHLRQRLRRRHNERHHDVAQPDDRRSPATRGRTWPATPIPAPPGVSPASTRSSWADRPVAARLGREGRGHHGADRHGHAVLRAPLQRRRPELSIRQLTLRLKRDDGAAVYLNGVEVAATTSRPAHSPPARVASSAVTGRAERPGTRSTVPGNLLVAGDNVIAAEVHQDTTSERRLDLRSPARSQTPAETNPPTRPDRDAHGPDRRHSISFSWTASTDDAGILGYVVRRNGAVIAYTTDTSFDRHRSHAGTDLRLPGRGDRHFRQRVDHRVPRGVRRPRSVHFVNSGDTWSYLADGHRPGHRMAPARIRRIVVVVRPVAARLGRTGARSPRSRPARCHAVLRAPLQRRPTRRTLQDARH